MRAAVTSSGPVGEEVRRRLATTVGAEQRELVVDLLRVEIAAVLGHPNPSSLPDRGLLELGFTSLTTVELRNRLNAVTGVPLPVKALADNPRLDELADRLSAALAGSAAPATEAAGAREGSLTTMFRQAVAQDRSSEFVELLARAAAFRPVFHRPDEPGAVPDPVRLAVEGAGRHLVCLPSALALSGPLQFARFAAALRGELRVTALPLPGFQPDEPLPGDLEALLVALSAAVSAVAGQEPFTLVGYSSGGLLAHEVAGRLGAEALVLLDSRPLGDYGPADRGHLLAGLAERTQTLDDTRLIAMGGYLPLLDTLRLETVEVPTLLVTAAEPGAAGAVSWPLAHTEVSAPGDHFSLIEADAETTAAEVRDWLTDVREG